MYRIQRPSADAIAKRLLEIARAEKIQMSTQEALNIARGSGCDVRQAINELEFCSKGDMSLGNARQVESGLVVDRIANPFDVVSTLFGCNFKDSIRLGVTLYDADAILGPMMIHENYLKTSGMCAKRFGEVADAISVGDLCVGAGRRWSVMPDVQAVLGCAVPCVLTGARLDGRVEFPTAMGKASTTIKNVRLITNITRKIGCVSRMEVAVDVIPWMVFMLIDPLVRHSAMSKLKKESLNSGQCIDQVQEIAVMLKSLRLNRDDWNVIQDLGIIEGAISRRTVSAVTKAALTKKMNNFDTKKGTKRQRVSIKRDRDSDDDGSDNDDGGNSGSDCCVY